MVACELGRASKQTLIYPQNHTAKMWLHLAWILAQPLPRPSPAATQREGRWVGRHGRKDGYSEAGTPCCQRVERFKKKKISFNSKAKK